MCHERGVIWKRNSCSPERQRGPLLNVDTHGSCNLENGQWTIVLCLGERVLSEGLKSESIYRSLF